MFSAGCAKVRCKDVLASIILVTSALAFTTAATSAEPATELKSPDDFNHIVDDSIRSSAIFEEIGKVLRHPRCLNCHPRNDRPRQGDNMAAHQPPVIRGPGGLGAPGMRCSTCHGTDNVAYESGEGSMPGHLPWLLAPSSMGWKNKSLSDICRQMKDPTRNGDRTLEELYDHNRDDGLVGWAWDPGKGRTPAPGSQELFGALTRAWIDSGAYCP